MVARIILGGGLGGLVVFVWGAVSHMVLGLTDKAFQPLPNEAAVMAAIAENVKEPGIYSFPFGVEIGSGDEAANEAYEKRYMEGPNGILLRGRDGEKPMGARQLSLEYVACFGAALIASIVVAAMGTKRDLFTKVLVVTLLGAFAWLSQNASYWIWYRFPTSLEVPELIDAVVGWFLAGGVLAVVVRPPRA
jgi:hypothetical protein